VRFVHPEDRFLGADRDPSTPTRWKSARAEVLLALGELAGDVPLDRFLESAGRMVASAVQSRHASIYSRLGEGSPFVTLCATDMPVDPQQFFPDGQPFADAQSLIAAVVGERTALMINDPAQLPPSGRALWPEAQRVLVVPIVRRNEVIALAVAEGSTKDYTDEDGSTLRLVADLVLSVVERERAREATAVEVAEHRRTFWSIVEAMSKLTEFRDPYTAGHQRSVAALSAAIGQEFGLADHDVDGLRAAGHLHDLGKIGIPSEILVKPGRLSEVEMSLVRTHCQIGLDIIAGISFPWDIARPVIEHHERLDGSGYPHGLAGDEIALASRVVAVADVVESMSSPRPYRSTWSVEWAVEEIRRGAGLQYDAAVVEACCEVIRRHGGHLPRA